MITIRWLVVGKYATIDRETADVSIFGAMAGIAPVGLPAVFPGLAVVADLKREQGDPPTIGITLRILTNGAEQFVQPVAVDFQDKFLCHVAVNIQNALVTEPGSMTFELSGPGIEARTFDLEVHVPQPLASPVTGT